MARYTLEFDGGQGGGDGVDGGRVPFIAHENKKRKINISFFLTTTYTTFHHRVFSGNSIFDPYSIGGLHQQ